VKIEDSVVIVTGASAGIGKATAELLAVKGANVVVVARREERLNRLVEDLSSYPGRRLSVPGNVQEEAFANELVDRTVANFGRIDVLINNAGVGHRHLLADMPSTDMRMVFETNVFGLLYATQATVSHMKKQGRGQIINVSSVAGQRPLPQSALYSASKTAVNFISRSLRMELRRCNIIVTLVYPGRTLTEFGDARLGRKGDHPSRLGRVAPERVAMAIVRAIQHGRTEVYVTWYDWLITHFSRLLPKTTDWVVGQLAGFA
jgi:short-subunit dehydrogenase